MVNFLALIASDPNIDPALRRQFEIDAIRDRLREKYDPRVDEEPRDNSGPDFPHEIVRDGH